MGGNAQNPLNMTPPLVTEIEQANGLDSEQIKVIEHIISPISDARSLLIGRRREFHSTIHFVTSANLEVNPIFLYKHKIKVIIKGQKCLLVLELYGNIPPIQASKRKTNNRQKEWKRIKVWKVLNAITTADVKVQIEMANLHFRFSKCLNHETVILR